MADYCESEVTFTHRDPAKQEWLAQVLQGEDPFNAILPAGESHDERIEAWGTKCCYCAIKKSDGCYQLQTAWDPPTGICKELLRQGFELSWWFAPSHDYPADELTCDLIAEINSPRNAGEVLLQADREDQLRDPESPEGTDG